MAYPLPSHYPVASTDLALTLISLEDWALVTVNGADSQKYLQGQLTCDITALTEHQYTFAAHCEAKGKMFSDLLLFPYNDGFAYIQRRDVTEKQTTELKKYAVFSKVTITQPEDRVLLGLAGVGARDRIENLFAQLPDAETPVVQNAETTLIHLAEPSERFLIATTSQKADQLYQALVGNIALNGSCQWLTLNIEAGIPTIDLINTEQFIPQAVNMQALNAISFTKGCYAGQEMVARAKYRGANKRAMYWLAGKAIVPPKAGDDLELKLEENWRRTGTILSCVTMEDGTIWIQAVLNNDLSADQQLRVRGDESSLLTIQPLPYSLTA